MKLHFVLPLMLLGSIAQAAARETNAAYLQGLFAAACLANLGNPEGTRKWAADHQLAAITDPASFQVFAGPGAEPPDPMAPTDPGSAVAIAPGEPGSPTASRVKPAAWTVPGPGPHGFVLSLRGAIGACGVWAQQADPQQVLSEFLKGAADPANPDVTVRKVAEKTSTTPFGILTMMIYLIAGKAPGGFLFTVLTSERPGGAFQASLQVAPVSEP
jgi:hypothetical protein